MNHHFKWRKRWSFAAIFTVTLVLSITITLSTSLYEQTLAQRPSSYPRNQAVYVTSEDGTKIAIDVWLPNNLSPSTTIPAIMRTTPYRRALDYKDDSIEADPTASELNPVYKGDVETFNNSGYAVVLADTRGMGASFGNYTPYSATNNDIQDYNAVVDWIIAQPWSNGKVGAYGTSADGNTAELLAATNNPAVKAVVPRSVDFDIYHQFIFPGGIFRDRYVKGIAPTLESFATNDVCFGETGEACEQIKQELPFTGVKPVDEDKDRSQLQAAVQQRDNIDIYEAGQQVTYRDDSFELSGGTLDDYSPFNFKNDIERSGVAIFSRTGWLDSATADGVLSHFMTFRNPQQAVIGPWNHGPYKQANPYQSPDTPLTPSQQEQLAEIISFFDTYLKDSDGKSSLKREIRYYTMGEEKWKTTKVWPPRGLTNQRWFFGGNNTLSEKTPTSESGEDRYTVDFEATTGEDNRWPADLSKSITFNDRTEEDKKLLTYTSKPLSEDMEITGHPIVNLDITSTADDGAFFVYLEDVDENDNVTYITEGQLRVIHRKVSNETPPYVVFGPYHSFKQKDGQPLEPGKVTQLSFNLLPTSVLIKQGHRIRVAIAGHDKDTFARYPAEGTPEITVQRNTVNASYIDLPIMRHKQK